MTDYDTVIRFHKRLIAADSAYARNPTPDTHSYLMARQRDYYAVLLDRLRTTHRTHESVAVAFTKLLMKRAQQNRKQCTDDPEWQALAYYQYQRAARWNMRAQALHRARPRGRPPRPKLDTARHQQPKNTKRIKHPLTGRYVWVPLAQEQPT